MGKAERLQWMTAFAETGSATLVCARFAISRPTLAKWLRRYRDLGPAGLEDASRRPASSPNRKVFAREEALILDLRRRGGLGLHRLRAELRRAHGLDLSADTIVKVLRRAGETMRHEDAALRPPPPAARTATGIPGAAPGFHGIAADDRVAAAIATLVVQGVFRPGEKLSEAALAARLGVGRALVREALQRLAFGGFVTVARNRGAFVADPSLAEVEQAYAARRLIEGEIVADVCRHCTAHDIRLLRHHIAQQVAARDSGDRSRFVHLITEFHAVLASLGENRLLEGFVRQLAAKTSLAVLLYDGAPPACAVEEHAALVDHLMAADVAGAQDLMRRHLTGNQSRLPSARTPP